MAMRYADANGILQVQANCEVVSLQRLRQYWKNRQTQQGKIYWDKGPKHYYLAEHQNWRCPVCGEHLFNGEQLQTHRVIRLTDGGTDRADNLLHLHKTCHQHLHMGKQPGEQKA